MSQDFGVRSREGCIRGNTGHGFDGVQYPGPREVLPLIVHMAGMRHAYVEGRLRTRPTGGFICCLLLLDEVERMTFMQGQRLVFDNTGSDCLKWKPLQLLIMCAERTCSARRELCISLTSTGGG